MDVELPAELISGPLWFPGGRKREALLDFLDPAALLGVQELQILKSSCQNRSVRSCFFWT